MSNSKFKSIAIKVQNLTKTYKLYNNPTDRLKEALNPFKKKYHKDFHALSDVSFEIKKGETVGIIGRNGSGKSTLLKMITGVLTPSSGRVTLHGRISAILELGSGFNPEMSGLENVYLNTSINGMNKKATDKKIEEILEFAELGDFIYQPLKSYSSGMKARLAFAVAINIEPDILIVDEALSVGDAAFQRKCFAKMESIREAGATILFVSHNEGSIVSLCSRAIWISNGEQIIDGEPKLVTGLYMKNANKRVVEKETIQKEYASLVENKDAKESKKIETPKENINQLSDEFYNPNLKSTSIIENPSLGAKIINPIITTPEGKIVNVLANGKQYFLNYEVEFDKDFSKNDFNEIKMSILIKNIQGIIISGRGLPISLYHIDSIKKGETYSLKWSFVNKFNAGEYYFSCAINLWKEDKVVLHRIKDAICFRVANTVNSYNHGIIDLDMNLKIKGSKCI